MDRKIKFMFWWRLTDEKWFDLIIKRIEKYKSSQTINDIHIDIFGDGVYSSELQNLIAVNKIQTVKYHWRQPKATITKYISETDYALMPSRFIETFGLSALESCENGKPLIGFRKWGLSQFILPELDIDKYHSDNWEFWQFEKCMLDIVNNFDINIYTSQSHTSSRISKNFTQKKRLQNLENIISK